MKTPIAVALFLVLLGASEAGASQINPLVAPKAPWVSHIREMDAALAAKNLKAAERAWREAGAAAVGSGFWEGMVAVGDAALRIGAAAGARGAAEGAARRFYVDALLRARQLASVEGVLRAAEAFAALGDSATVQECLAIAEHVAREARTAQARNRVRAVRAQLTDAMREGGR